MVTATATTIEPKTTWILQKTVVFWLTTSFCGRALGDRNRPISFTKMLPMKTENESLRATYHYLTYDAQYVPANMCWCVTPTSRTASVRSAIKCTKNIKIALAPALKLMRRHTICQIRFVAIRIAFTLFWRWSVIIMMFCGHRRRCQALPVSKPRYSAHTGVSRCRHR